jgi:hypothetical protein
MIDMEVKILNLLPEAGGINLLARGEVPNEKSGKPAQAAGDAKMTPSPFQTLLGLLVAEPVAQDRLPGGSPLMNQGGESQEVRETWPQAPSPGGTTAAEAPKPPGMPVAAEGDRGEPSSLWKNNGGEGKAAFREFAGLPLPVPLVVDQVRADQVGRDDPHKPVTPSHPVLSDRPAPPGFFSPEASVLPFQAAAVVDQVKAELAGKDVSPKNLKAGVAGPDVPPVTVKTSPAEKNVLPEMPVKAGLVDQAVPLGREVPPPAETLGNRVGERTLPPGSYHDARTGGESLPDHSPEAALRLTREAWAAGPEVAAKKADIPFPANLTREVAQAAGEGIVITPAKSGGLPPARPEILTLPEKPVSPSFLVLPDKPASPGFSPREAFVLPFQAAAVIDPVRADLVGKDVAPEMPIKAGLVVKTLPAGHEVAVNRTELPLTSGPAREVPQAAGEGLVIPVKSGGLPPARPEILTLPDKPVSPSFLVLPDKPASPGFVFREASVLPFQAAAVVDQVRADLVGKNIPPEMPAQAGLVVKAVPLGHEVAAKKADIPFPANLAREVPQAAGEGQVIPVKSGGLPPARPEILTLPDKPVSPSFLVLPDKSALPGFSNILSAAGAATRIYPDESKAALEILRPLVASKLFEASTQALSSTPQQVKILLNPPELGQMLVKLLVKNARAKVEVLVESTEVRQLVIASADALRNNLQTQGITVEQVNVIVREDFLRAGYGQGQAGAGQDFSPGNQAARTGEEKTPLADQLAGMPESAAGLPGTISIYV